MRVHSFKALAAGGLFLGLVLAAAATRASTTDHVMYVTFSGAVALPGVELSAGTYVFELADGISDHSVVRVSSKDRRKTYLQAFTNPIERPRNLKEGQIVTLGESARGVAPQVRAWYPDGASMGREFIYP